MVLSTDKALIILPTYNEKESLPSTVAGILEHAPNVDILVVDDNSPDGTGFIADQLSAADSRVNVLHREKKEGLGAAYIAGFSWGLKRSYRVLMEMDADGSHQPKYIPDLLAGIHNAGLVMGSRWVPGGGTVGWPKKREILSRGGSWYARFMLGIPVRDATGGFRAYRSEVLENIGLESIDSTGYCFQIDLVRRVCGAGYTVKEVPIVFVERQVGVSKMNYSIIIEALLRVTMWGFGRFFKKAP